MSAGPPSYVSRGRAASKVAHGADVENMGMFVALLTPDRFRRNCGSESIAK